MLSIPPRYHRGEQLPTIPILLDLIHRRENFSVFLLTAVITPEPPFVFPQEVPNIQIAKVQKCDRITKTVLIVGRILFALLENSRHPVSREFPAGHALHGAIIPVALKGSLLL
jgi:hypothetical protein